MCLLGIEKTHIEYCTNIKCYCKTEEKIITGTDKNIENLTRGQPKDTFDDKFEFLRDTKSIKKAIGYLEQQFENYISFYGQSDDEVVYLFIKFLIMYSGKTCRAIQLYNSKKKILANSNNSTDTNTDLEDALIILEKAVQKN
jgi:hypothetical protein